jgi:hypothetical protein
VLAALPGISNEVVLVNDTMYAYVLSPTLTSMSLVRLSLANNSTQTIYSEIIGGGNISHWLAASRDFALYVDFASVPPKAYEVRGDRVTPLAGDDVGQCPLQNWSAVFDGARIVSVSLRNPPKLNGCPLRGVTITDLETKTTRAAEFAEAGVTEPDVGNPQAIGAREEWVYVVGEGGSTPLFRISTIPSAMELQ